jgi:hypothetical protein
LILAPTILPSSNIILINFPKRDEFLFAIVAALPKISKIGLAARIKLIKSIYDE